MLSVPLNVHVITALEEEPKSLMALRRAVGSPPETTMRGHLRTLSDLAVVERNRCNSFPGSIHYTLTPAGQDLVNLAYSVQSWLDQAPRETLDLGTIGARGVIKALVEGWSSTLVRALAARPLALTELDRLIAGLNYPSIERRLGAMRMADLIEARRGSGRGTPYVATAWLRRAVAPLVGAAGWERRRLPAGAAPSISRLDIEATFLLSIPLLTLPDDLTGSCRLTVELSGNGRELAGVVVGVKDGRVEACVSHLPERADAWVSGKVGIWLQEAAPGDGSGLEIGGDRAVAKGLLEEFQCLLGRKPSAVKAVRDAKPKRSYAHDSQS
jgi:DNA-binding HxlR family transcriptional regulator